MAGFGLGPFGKGPFGRSDLGFDLVIERFPSEYLGEGLPEGTDVKDNDKDPLLMVLKTVSYAVNKRRVDIDNMETLIDYEKAPLEIVRLLGAMLGLGIDKNDPEFLQRSFLGNASQWLQLKASKRGYQVRGLASGFTVSVENFWRIDETYLPYIPARHLFYLKPPGADLSAPAILHTDSPPGTYPFTSTEENETYAKSSYVRVVFEVAEPRKSGVDYNKLLDLVIDKIKDVVGIHHELTAPQFLVRMNVPINVTVDMLAQEHLQDYQHNVFHRYDITIGDIIPCDYDEPIVQILEGTSDLIALYASAMASVVYAVDSLLSTTMGVSAGAEIVPGGSGGDTIYNIQATQPTTEQLEEVANLIVNTTMSALYEANQLIEMMVNVSTSLGLSLAEQSTFTVVANAAAQILLTQDTEYSIDVLESAVLQSIGEEVFFDALEVGTSLNLSLGEASSLILAVSLGMGISLIEETSNIGVSASTSTALGVIEELLSMVAVSAGTIGLTPEEASSVSASIILSILMAANEELANIAVAAGPGLAIGVIDEFLSMTIDQPPGVSLEVEEDTPVTLESFYSFDTSPADIYNSDAGSAADMTIIVGP